MEVFCIIGPTSSGKSYIAHTVARNLRKIGIESEIISCDSVQVYKHFDIGTDKVPKQLREEFRYHFIDILEPNEGRFSAGEFRKKFDEITTRILSLGKVPILVGGTGLYYKAVRIGIFEGPSANQNIREKLYKTAQEKGTQFLYNILLNVDSEYAKKISQNDLKRIVRALEVYEITGTPISLLHKSLTKPSPFRMYAFFILPRRDVLYSSINSRVDRMIESGLIEEVKSIIETYGLNIYPLSSIGYKEVVDYLLGKISFERMIHLIKKNTRNFAKRQITLFKNTIYDEQINIEDISKQTLEEISNYISEKILKLRKDYTGTSQILSSE